MKLSEILRESSRIEFTTLEDEYGEVDYERAEAAEALVNANGLRMLRDDEITDIALDGDKVVGVMFSAVHGTEMNTSIAVDPKYRGQHIAARLFDNIFIDDHIEKHIAELIPPYTLEPFLIKRGYTFVGHEGDFKLYEKDIEST